MSRLLVTRPEHDLGTRYLSRWSEEILKEAKRRGIEVSDLHKEKAVRREFEGRVKKFDPAFVLMNGHGSERSVTGHDDETLVEQDDNAEILHGRVTYAVSCDSAAELGKAVAQEKDTAYIGYTKSFIFNINRKYINKPTSDSRASQFLEASNQVPFSLFKGHSAQEASRRSKDAFRRAILKLLSSAPSDPEAQEDAKELLWDMTHQVCLGVQDKRMM